MQCYPRKKEHHEQEHSNEKSPMCLGNNRKFIWNARCMVAMVAMMSDSRMPWATSTYLDFILHDQMSMCEDNSYSKIKIGWIKKRLEPRSTNRRVWPQCRQERKKAHLRALAKNRKGEEGRDT